MRWSLAAFVAGVAALYVLAIEAVLAIAGPPMTGRAETAVVVVGCSLLVSWLGTARAAQLIPAGWPHFLLPGILHGFVLAAIALVAATSI